MPERIRKASSTTERSRRMLSGGTKTVTKTKSTDSQGNTLKKRTVTKSAKYGGRLDLGHNYLRTDPRTQTKTSLKEKLANGSTRKVKTKTLERRTPGFSAKDNSPVTLGKLTTTARKEKTKSPGSKTIKKTASESVKGWIDGPAQPSGKKEMSYREGKRRTKFH